MANEILSTDNILEPYGGSINNDLINVMGNINEEEEINMTHMSPYYAIDSLPLKAKNGDRQFTLLSLNSQSIHAKLSSLEGVLHHLSGSGVCFDVICLQENWLNNDADLSLLQLEGYACISQGYKCSSHGGLMMYVHSKYKYVSLDYYTESNIWEGLFIEVSGNSLESNICNSVWG